MRSLFYTLPAVAVAAALCAAVPAQADHIVVDEYWRPPPEAQDFSLDIRVGWFAPVTPGNPVSIEFKLTLTTVDPYTTPTMYPRIEVSSNGQTVVADEVSWIGDHYKTTYLLAAPLIFNTPGLFNVNWKWSGTVFLDYFQEVYIGSDFRRVETEVTELVYYEYTQEECDFYGLCGGFWEEETYTVVEIVEVPIYDIENLWVSNYLLGESSSFTLLVDPITGGGLNLGGTNGEVAVGVPEPASLALFGAGLLGLFGLRRRAPAA
ncbi:PEP-CTERM sorting domain-containing protein [Falsiroseomonas oryzae]|uniref:PEP-CTERM sorting domain-containing protein n=1 Tax=Falsiroseomonas oryzae TaxID=2766473 RepID=UPI0022EB6583|nr:PEP-CTERM sorting domain-containing protein [Roseomonas sp. MO-31]